MITNYIMVIVCKLWRNLGRVRLMLSSATRPIDGTTACKWDTIIPFDAMWENIKRIRKQRAAVVLFGSEPFSSLLRVSNLKEYKYDWVWDKKFSGCFVHADKQPLKTHENIMIFSDSGILPAYHPQMTKRKTPIKSGGNGQEKTKAIRMKEKDYVLNKTYNEKFPTSQITFSNRDKDRGFHPTQKPVALMEYLIKTYTNEGDTVLDFTMGSGSTGVAAMRTGRKFIGIEQDAEYFDIAQQRIANAAGDYVTTPAEKERGQLAIWDLT